MTKKLLEMVCNGNTGRSPPMEAVANIHLRKIGAAGDYSAISSGTRVNINPSSYSPEEVRTIVDLYTKMGWGDLVGDLDKALKEGYPDLVPYLKQLQTSAVRKEVRFRNGILSKKGIDSSLLKTTQDQTIPRTDVIAILTADKGNYDRVKNVYRGSGHKIPETFVLSELATGILGREITFNVDNFTPENMEQEYERIYDQIIEETPKAIDRILRDVRRR